MAVPVTTEENELRAYATTVMRRKWTVLLTTLVIGAVSFGNALLETPRYSASAALLLKPVGSIFGTSRNEPTSNERAVATQARVVISAPVKQLVRAELGSAPPVDVRASSDSDLLEIRAVGADPTRIARVANAYAEAYVRFRRESAVTELEDAVRVVSEKISELDAEIDRLDAEVAAAPPSQREALAADLGSERKALIDQQTFYRQTIDRLQLEAGLDTGGAQIVAPATAPSVPFAPNPRRSLILGLTFGLLLGVAIAFGRDWLDDTVRNAGDLERVTHGRPVLGFIPDFTAGRSGRRAVEVHPVPALSDPTSPAAEAFRGLRTSIQFLDLDHPMSILAVTSPASGEGKTAVSANLGVTLARSGQRVVIVSCDLRRPRLHEAFGISNEVGFTSVLLGSSSLSAALVPIADQPNLVVLPAGPLPPNPAELLSSARTTEVLTSLRAIADIVILDCAPLVPVTDAAVISNRVDGLLLVTTVRKTSRRQLGRALEIVRQIDAPMIGTVLNKVEPEGPYTYVYVPSEQSGRAAQTSTRV